jgi:hypothetical protein
MVAMNTFECPFIAAKVMPVATGMTAAGRVRRRAASSHKKAGDGAGVDDSMSQIYDNADAAGAGKRFQGQKMILSSQKGA